MYQNLEVLSNYILPHLPLQLTIYHNAKLLYSLNKNRSIAVVSRCSDSSLVGSDIPSAPPSTAPPASDGYTEEDNEDMSAPQPEVSCNSRVSQQVLTQNKLFG